MFVCWLFIWKELLFFLVLFSLPSSPQCGTNQSEIQKSLNLISRWWKQPSLSLRKLRMVWGSKKSSGNFHICPRFKEKRFFPFPLDGPKTQMKSFILSKGGTQGAACFCTQVKGMVSSRSKRKPPAKYSWRPALPSIQSPLHRHQVVTLDVTCMEL